MKIDLKNSTYILNENDFIFINSYDFMSTKPNLSSKCIFLEILIDTYAINKYYNKFSDMKFKCYSGNDNIFKIKYDIIRNFIYNIVNVSLESKIERNVYLLNYLMEFSLFIIDTFKVEEKSLYKKKNNMHRLVKILNYLEENYSNDLLSIDDISNYIELSPQYILKIFRENLDVGLTDYLNSLRIKKSINDILYTGKSILEVALDNGFNNTKTYHRIFKKIYNCSPRKYKKEQGIIKKERKNIKFINKDLILKELLMYSKKGSVATDKNRLESITIDIDFNKNIIDKKLEPYWKKIVSLGKVSEGLKGDIQYQIKEINKDINPTYIKFNGIFNDEMNIYNEDARGNIIYNFSAIDKFLDFLMKENLKPFINIGFMPKKLASKEQYISASNINTSYPKKLKLWIDLVENFIIHILHRYEEGEVKLWYFEIWNNPDLKNIYWHESDEKFFCFFKETFDCIKRISPSLKVGGPACIPRDYPGWIEKFLDFTKKEKIELDFISFHYYHMNFKFVEKNNYNEDNNYITDIDSNLLYKKSIIMNKNIIGDSEIILSEWNLSPFKHFLYDTCYVSSFITEVILNNFNSINGIVYWTSTENKSKTDIFYGGLGLFTTNNLKKASYNAFLLLNKLGTKFISKGNNYFITRKNNSFQILLYRHNRKLVKNVEDISKNSNLKEIQLKFNNFEKGGYDITKYYLNKDSGSIYDAWLEMGSPDKLTNEMFKYLKSKENMKMRIEKVEVKDRLIIKESLSSNSVVFLEIKKVAYKNN